MREQEAVPPAVHEVGKTLAKYGTKGITKAGHKLNTYEKIMADDRINHLIKSPFKLDTSEAIKELPKDTGVRYDYLTTLLDQVRKKDEVRTIMAYIKSTAAANLSPDQRAQMLARCLEKLKYVDLIGQFLS